MLTIKTNNVPRDVIEAYELTPAEREEFGYINWRAVDNGEESGSFVRFKGELYDLGEFMRTDNLPELAGWDGYQSDSYFSGLVVRFVEDNERVVMGTYFS